MNAVALLAPVFVPAPVRKSALVVVRPQAPAVPKHIITGRYTSSLGLRLIGLFAPAFAERMLELVREWVERVSEPVGGHGRVVTR